MLFDLKRDLVGLALSFPAAERPIKGTLISTIFEAVRMTLVSREAAVFFDLLFKLFIFNLLIKVFCGGYFIRTRNLTLVEK